MKWKDSEEELKNNAEAIEDYYDEEEYSPWKKTSVAEIFSRFTERFPMPLVLGALGIVIVVLLVVVLIPDSPKVGNGRDVASFESRLNELETRIIRMEEELDKVGGLDFGSQDKKIKMLLSRFDRLEKTTALRIEHLEDTIERKMTKASSAASKPSPQKAATVAKPSEKSSPPPSKARYHTVVAGDTLFSLGRRYGISVDELRKLNGISPNNSIRIGQRLRVE